MATSNRSGWLTLGVAAALLLVAATGASQARPNDVAPAASYASASSVSSASLFACVKKKNGRMRMITSGPCDKGEYLVVWSVVGPPGARGVKGPTGSTGPVGPVGPVGPEGPVGPPDGSTVLSGQGQPTASVGKAGDFYVNLQDWSMWGPKTGGTWSLGTTLIGPPGPIGPRGPGGGSGPAGPQGPAGATGLQGPPGVKGDTGAQGAPGGFGAYGSFDDTGTVNLSASVATAVPLRRTLFAQSVSIVDDTGIRMATAGKYNIAFSLQLYNRANARRTITLWLSKNGVGVGNWMTWTSTDVQLGTAVDTERHVAAWNFFVDASAGDTYTLMVVASGLDVDVLAGSSLNTNPAGIPQIPSTILTVNQVG